MPAPLLALLLSLSPLAAGDDDILVARAGEIEFQREGYSLWLVERYGVQHLNDYVTDALILRACADRGLLPSDEDVAAAYASERQQNVDNFFKGDDDAYDVDLARRGFAPETYARVRRSTLKVELAEQALAAERRTISEEALRRRFSDLYASGGTEQGEHVSLEVIFFDMYAAIEEGARPDMATMRAEARERATRAATVMAEGAPLADVLPLGDPVPSTFVEAGRLSPYRRMILGPQVERAVSKLDEPGDTSPPVQVYNGYYLVRLNERIAVSLEHVREDLRAMLLAEPPDSSDILALRNWVIEEYGAELLLR